MFNSCGVTINSYVLPTALLEKCDQFPMQVFFASRPQLGNLSRTFSLALTQTLGFTGRKDHSPG